MNADVTFDDQGRPEPPLAADEVEAALGFLDYQRATLRWKCSGVDAEGLKHRLTTSAMTLGGLLKHMALVEDSWFSRRLWGNDRAEPWASIDWEHDQDWDFESASENSAEELLELWDTAVSRSRDHTDRALADGGFDRLGVVSWPDGRRPNLRWIVLHMIEEYARHNGHADLLREAVDGSTGE